MKKIVFPIILTLVSLICVSNLFSQDWKWSGHATGTSDMEDVTGMILDPSGFLYVTGTFGVGATLDGIALTTQGVEDIFLAKYDPSGTLLWVRTGGSIHKDLSRGVEIDGSGNVYVSGLYRYTAEFDSLALDDKGSRSLISADTKRNAFIAKYNSSGQMQWVKTVAWGPGNEVPEGISFDDNDDLYISGTFRDTCFFDNDTLVTQKPANNEGYIAKYDNNGDLIWAKHLIQTDGLTKFLNISTTVNDQIYLAGILKDTMWADGFEVYSKSEGIEDIMLMKINDDGDVQWIRKGGGSTADRGNSVYADPFGSVFITGYFTGNDVRFDSTGLNMYDSHLLNWEGGYDMFVAKYNNAGGLRWIGTNGTIGDDIGYGLYANEEITLASGYFSDTIVFGNDTLKSSGGEETGFFVFDKGGAPIQGCCLKGDGEDRGAGLLFNESNTQTTIMGYFKSTDLSMPPLTSLTNALAGTSEGFIATYDNPISVAFTDKTDPLLCAGDSSGYIKAKTFFGAGTITYSWEHDPLLTLDHADNLPAGTYKVVVEDETGSKDSASVTLSYPPAIEITVEGSSNLDLPCPEDADGSIDITASGGEGTFTYTWNGTGGGICATCEDQTNLGPGDYYVTAMDALGCTTTDTITITRPPAFNFGASSVIDITINTPPPHDSGAVNLVFVGGTEPHTFAWTGPSSFSATSDTISGLYYGGDYSLTVTDDNSCTADTVFVVEDDTTFIAFIDFKQNVTCKGDNNGILEVEMANGKAPYTYDWRNQFDAPAGITKRVENLPPNTYTVTVTDDDGKEAQATAQIEQPTNTMIPLYSVSDPSCYGYANGSIDLTVTGGWGQYTYSWTPYNILTEDLTDIGAGTYSCIITDKEGCQAVVSNVDVDNPAFFMFDSIQETASVNCTGNQTAELKVFYSGGTEPVDYKWDDANFQETQTATGLGARSNPYKVVITDDHGCKVEGSKSLTEPTPVIVDSLTFTYPSVKGGSDASVTVYASGGTPSYQYRRFSGTYQVSSTFSGLSAGTDTIEVVDDNGCTSNLEKFTIPDPIQIDSIISVDILCNGAATGSICVYASGGHGTLSYMWTGGPSTNCYSSLTAGSYVVTISDSINMKIDSTVTLVQPDVISFSAPVVTDNDCNGGAEGSISLTASGGTGPFEYTIQPGGTMNSTGSFTALAAGKYVISIDDAESCGPKLTDTIIVSEQASISLSTPVVTDVKCFGGNDGSIAVTASGGTSPYSYTIQPGGTTNATGTFSALTSQKYVISITDDNSCGPKTTDSIAVGQPTMLKFDSILVEAAHNKNTNTGKITVFASGGIPAYKYYLDGVIQGDSIFDGLYSRTYIVKVEDNQGCIVENSSVVVGDSAVGIHNIAGYQNALLYPNPSKGLFTIELDNNEREDLMLEIVNITGQLVYKKLHEFNGSNRFIEIIDLSQQAKGTYFMRVNGLPVKAKLMIK